jgi:hypothetical protein
MTPAMLQLFTGFRDRLTQLGETILHQRTGTEFRAILSPLPPIVPQGELLDRDNRAAATLEARRDQIPADFRKGDLVEQAQPLWRRAEIADQFPNPVWRVTDRDPNTIPYAAKYWLVQVSSQDS